MNILCLFGFHDMNTWYATKKPSNWTFFPYAWGRCNRCQESKDVK